MKMHLASTDYGNFLQNEPSPISTTTLAEKCTVRRAAAPSRARASPFPPLTPLTVGFLFKSAFYVR